jgi:DNA polymerase-3 subunit delta
MREPSRILGYDGGDDHGKHSHVRLRLTADSLAGHLKRGLAPVYLIAGDEPLLNAEAADAVRSAARAAGFSDREVLVAESGFDWGELTRAGASLSLFGAKRILEFRLPSAKPGAAGAAALAAYAERPAEDTLLLVLTGKLARGGRESSWVKALDRAGVMVQIYPVTADKLPAWIERRLRSRGLSVSQEAVRLIAEQVEGNLLAASQEVDKLVLTAGSGSLDVDTVRRAVADSARFDVFGLVDTALAGDGARTLRVLSRLRAEGVEPALVLWALVRELRQLAHCAFRIERGAPRTRVLAEVWKTRRSIVGAALARPGRDARGWRRLLDHAGQVDRVIKGQSRGRPWDALTALAAGMAGISSAVRPNTGNGS